jgi:hypothetical protein
MPVLSIGPLLSELSASSETSTVGRLLPFVLLAFVVLAVAAVALGLRNIDRSDPPEDDTNGSAGD